MQRQISKQMLWHKNRPGGRVRDRRPVPVIEVTDDNSIIISDVMTLSYKVSAKFSEVAVSAKVESDEIAGYLKNDVDVIIDPFDADITHWKISEPIQGYVIKDDRQLLVLNEPESNFLILVVTLDDGNPVKIIYAHQTIKIDEIMELFPMYIFVEEKVMEDGYTPASVASGTPISEIRRVISDCKSFGYFRLVLSHTDDVYSEFGYVLNPDITSRQIEVRKTVGELGEMKRILDDEPIRIDFLRSTSKYWYLTHPHRGYIRKTVDSAPTLVLTTNFQVSDEIWEVPMKERPAIQVSVVRKPVDVEDCRRYIEEVEVEALVVVDSHVALTSYEPPDFGILRSLMKAWLSPVVALQLACVGAKLGNNPHSSSRIMIQEEDGKRTNLTILLAELVGKDVFSDKDECAKMTTDDQQKLTLTRLSILLAEAVVRHRRATRPQEYSGAIPYELDFAGAAIIEMPTELRIVHRKFRNEIQSRGLKFPMLPSGLYDYCDERKRPAWH